MQIKNLFVSKSFGRKKCWAWLDFCCIVCGLRCLQADERRRRCFMVLKIHRFYQTSPPLVWKSRAKTSSRLEARSVFYPDNVHSDQHGKIASPRVETDILTVLVWVMHFSWLWQSWMSNQSHQVFKKCRPISRRTSNSTVPWTWCGGCLRNRSRRTSPTSSTSCLIFVKTCCRL